jgi:hypothetical protein
MVGVAQLVERRVVVADVAGSSPVAHPTKDQVGPAGPDLPPTEASWGADRGRPWGSQGDCAGLRGRTVRPVTHRPTPRKHSTWIEQPDLQHRVYNRTGLSSPHE